MKTMWPKSQLCVCIYIYIIIKRKPEVMGVVQGIAEHQFSFTFHKSLM